MARITSTNKGKTQIAKKIPQSRQADTDFPTGELLAKLESTGITPEERSQLIEEMAYYRAEKRGFSPEGQLQDWLEAESIVDAMLSETAKKGQVISH
jgi:hypothetical protein